MRQTARIISTYTADVSGVCSALFELGGMTVMHDASGCNSTYNTHDEPRWYDTDSLVFLSGLTEMEAIMGDDGKLIGDVVSAANQLHPKFIALAGTPIPMITGTDFAAVAALIEGETGIPTFGFATNGMQSYLSGAGMAFAALAERMVEPDPARRSGVAVNLLGATPLDFSVNGAVEDMAAVLAEGGAEVVSCWAMGSDLERIARAGEATVNLVISYSGLQAARTLRRRFGTPYVVGAPTGERFTARLLADLEASAADGENRVSYTDRPQRAQSPWVIIGESVSAGSLAAALEATYGLSARVLCPLQTEGALLAPGDEAAPDEADLIPRLAGAAHVIADPLYRPICPADAAFHPWPHEAFSGRIYRDQIPNLVRSLGGNT